MSLLQPLIEAQGLPLFVPPKSLKLNEWVEHSDRTHGEQFYTKPPAAPSGRRVANRFPPARSV